mgnify:CR=1 FL=1
MLLFLQQNAEWMCAVAIVIFTAVQCVISYAQYKQELRLRRFNLAQQMDEACIIYKFDKESVQKIVDWFNKNQSQFMYLLNEKDLKHYDIFQALLKELYNTTPAFNDVIELYRKCLVRLDVALLNANYRIRKLKKVKKHKVRIHTWDEIKKT